MGPPVPEDLGVPDGGLSVGRPNRGRVQHAVQVPDLPYYTRRNPDILWGSSHAVRSLVSALARFRHESGFEGEVILGSMSRSRGGRFSPHRSHQSGRDIDIRLPLLPGVRPTHAPAADEVDWQAAWALVSSLIDTGEVHAIYLETRLQRRLYEAARQLGAGHEELVDKIQWPRSETGVVAIVRHQKGHDAHIHVRFSCAPDEDRCKTQSR
jgi:murein endopeptidase